MSVQDLLLVFMFLLVFGGILSGIKIIIVLMVVPLAIASVAVGMGVFDSALLFAIPERIYGIIGNQILFAVPLFVLMGKLLEHSGMGEKMLLSAAGLARNKGRGLALAVLVTSVVIASATGIIGATITMLATIALPAMIRAGMPEKMSAGLICAAGSLGQLVPPSIVLILLSDQVSSAWITSQRAIGNFSPEPISLAHLFAGALLPGLMLAGLYAIHVSYLTGRTQPQQISSDVADNHTPEFSYGSFLVFGVILFVPASVLLGLATAVEAAGIGVLGTAILMFFSGNGMFKRALKESVELTGVIFGIIIAASVLALVFRGLDGDVRVEAFLSLVPGDATGALLLVMAVIFLLGFILEFIEITYIVIPVVAPVLFSFGVDPIWFATLVAVNLQVSFLTPPLGIALFYFQSVSHIRAIQLYRGVIPFIGLQILALMIVFIFPKIATWLPSILI